MTAYFIRRFLLIIPTFIGITLLVFAVTRFVPGGPVEKILLQTQIAQQEGSQFVDTSEQSGAALSDEQIRELQAYYGFDKPVLLSYLSWLWKIVQLDLGTSSRYSEPVWDIVAERFPISIFYGLATLIITYGVCVPLGIVKAIRHGTSMDNITSILVFIGYAIPGYVVGIGLLVAFASHWEVFPLGGFVSDDFDDLETIWQKIGDIFYHAALPLIAYVAGSFAVVTFMLKNSLMDNISADYVRTAIAKGLNFRRAVFGHAIRNSLIPIATGIGGTISLVLTGSFLIEKIFNIDGFGLLGYESLLERDYPVVMGILTLSSLLFLIGNIISDICVAIIDPRVRFE